MANWIFTRTLPRTCFVSIDSIKKGERQRHELMLIGPSHLCLGEPLGLRGRRWRIRDLGDEVGSRGFCNAVDEYANKWDLEKDEEAYSEAEQNSFTLFEPFSLLFLGVMDSREVRFKLAFISNMLTIPRMGVPTNSLMRLRLEKYDCRNLTRYFFGITSPVAKMTMAGWVPTAFLKV